VTLTPVLDGAASARTYATTLGSGTSGLQCPNAKPAHNDQRARALGMKVSGSHSVAFAARAVEYGRWAR
jgi:hypothetical protein